MLLFWNRGPIGHLDILTPLALLGEAKMTKMTSHLAPPRPPPKRTKNTKMTKPAAPNPGQKHKPR